MTTEELCQLFKSVDRHGKTNRSSTSYGCNIPSYMYMTHFFETMSLVKGHHSNWKPVVTKYLHGEEEECFMVPFQTVLQFVATRQVTLKRGIAHVPVCKLRETVTRLFKELLHSGMRRFVENFHTEDRRIKTLLRTIKVSIMVQL